MSGDVYSGNYEGRAVAIKFLKPTDGLPEGRLQQEVKIQKLVQSRSRNIVPLLGVCEAADALVYPRYEGGSLEVRLGLDLATSKMDCSGLKLQEAIAAGASRPAPLSYLQRLRVAVQAAEAIMALHFCQPPIVHRDIKPSNVLLDHLGDAALSDTEFARTLIMATDIQIRIVTDFRASTTRVGARSFVRGAKCYPLLLVFVAN